ncbi:MAG: GNAT family N-acetyltransferase [Gaiellaceae bacterium]
MELELKVIPAGLHPGLEAYAAVRSAVVPREPVTAEEIERSRLRKPGDVRMLARVDWHVAGCAGAIPSDLPNRTYAAIAVLPEFRRHGIGTAFLERIAAIARRRGSGIVSGAIEEGDGAAAAFTSRFGLVEVFREIEVARSLGGDEADGPAPVGIEIVPVGDRPGLVEGAYALAREALPEMPLPEPYVVPPFAEWAEEDATGPGVIGEASLVALDGARVVAFAGLLRRAADSRLAEHGLTAVAAGHRGRGIATALKRRQIAWATRHGYRELVTWTQDGNDAMQAVNRKLGYAARPAWIRLEAPLETVEAALGRRA